MDTRFTNQLSSRGRIPQILTLTELQLVLNDLAISRIPSAVSLGESSSKLLVPHKTTTFFRFEKTGWLLSACYKTC